MALGSVAYLFRFISIGVDGVVTLNGYPIARSMGRPSHVESRKVNDLLVEGANTFIVDVRRSVAREDDLAGSTLARGVHSTEPQEVTLLFEHQFHDVDGVPPDDTAHEVFRHDVRLDRAFGRWQWQGARPYRREDLGDVVALHRAIASAAERRDVDALLGLFRMKYEELGRSVEVSAGEALAGAAEGWRRVFSGPDVRVSVASDEDLSTRSWSDGRLVEVMGRDGTAPVTVHGASEGLQLSVPYVVSVVDGRVQIAR